MYNVGIINNQMTKNRGFIRLILLLVIVLIVLGYFGFNIENILKSPAVSGNLRYVWSLVTAFWNNFLIGPAAWIWNHIIVGIFWNSLLSLAAKIQPRPPQ